jgi:RecJ-like exonuclease
MNEREAFARLKPPLIFGNEWQIEAVRFLSWLEEKRALGEDEETNCPECDGTGEIVIECEECDGTGTISDHRLTLVPEKSFWLPFEKVA